MGKSPGRAILSRRINATAELFADIRQRYEHTSESLATMAADLGCSTETVRNIAKREGWVHYVPPPRDLTPAAKLAARARKLVYPPKLAEQAKADPPSPAASAGQPAIASATAGQPAIASATAGDLPPPGGGEEEASASQKPPQVADTAEQLHRELQGLLAEVRATRERMKREGYGKRELREAARTIADLTASLRMLQSLQCPAPQAGTDDNAYDDMPADLDEFRRELARRIAVFMESRPDDGDAGAVSADDAAAPQS